MKSMILRKMTRTLLVTGLLALGLSATAASALPGAGIKVQGLQSPLSEETFQTLLVNKAMEKLGYDVLPIKEVEYPASHIAVANGDATFIADHWNPQHAEFYKQAGGDEKLSRKGAYSKDAAQGYLIDKKTAFKYNITNIGQLTDPKLAKLFDADGDGKADMTGCTPGWGCEGIVEHQLTVFKLRDTITHHQGSYAPLIADTITRFKAGKPVLYYTWTPYWVSAQMRPGIDVVWLEVPFTSLPGEQAKLGTKLPNGKNYGFVINKQQIVGNKKFIEANPAAAKLFEIMALPVADINAQNMRMSQGENTSADIERHTNGWIKAHQKTFDSWIAQSLAAAQ